MWCHIWLAMVMVFGILSSAMAQDKVVLFAAASLTNALEEITSAYRQTHQVNIVASYAASSTLARQLIQGAQADLFISADQQWMNYAIEQQVISPATRVTLLGNDLVLVATAEHKIAPISIDSQTDWLELLQGGRLAVGDPDHVPAGIYAKQALQTLGVWEQLSPHLARANDVRVALALVERGEAPLGILYGSDARISQKVTLVGKIPLDTHQAVEYPMAIVKGREKPAVVEFYHYLQTPNALAVFQRYGFNVTPH